MTTASPEFIASFNELLTDPANLAELKRRLNIPAAVPTVTVEPKIATKTIEEKHFRRNEVYAGVMGTWQEWSFNFLTAVSGVNLKVGEALAEIGKASTVPLTEESLQLLVHTDLRDKHGAELFGVLCQLTTGDANAVVRGIIAKAGLGRCGFAAFYALSFRFNARTPSTALQFLFQVINPPRLKDVRHIPKAVEDWEAQRSMLRDEFLSLIHI